MVVKPPFHHPKPDSPLVLTNAEIEDNYFIDYSGEKKKYRRGLRNLLIIGGIIISLIGLGFWPVLVIGIGAIIAGSSLPNPH